MRTGTSSAAQFERKCQVINNSDVAAALIVIAIGRWNAVVSG